MSSTGTRTIGLLLKIPEAAELLAIGRSTVYELIALGHLETVHIGRSVRVTTASIEAFIERERSGQREVRATAAK
jgi:excisionase family DNA binding protein